VLAEMDLEALAFLYGDRDDGGEAPRCDYESAWRAYKLEQALATGVGDEDAVRMVDELWARKRQDLEFRRQHGLTEPPT
jgi:hypothetical protein